MNRSNLRVVDQADSRSSGRTRNLRSGKVVFGAFQFSRDCTIRDVSDGGVRIRIEDPESIPNEFWLLDIRNFVALKAEVRWRRNNDLGLSVGTGCSMDDTETLEMRTLSRLAIEAKQRAGG